MARTNAPLLAFNRGIVSRRALARVDVDRIRLSAEVMTNWLPKTQGSMLLRPGFEYLGSSRNNAPAIDIGFVAATDDTALIEVADSKLRVRVGDELISRPAVSTTVPNSNFSSSSGWSDASTHGGAAGFGGAGLVLNAVTRGGLALVRRQITVAGADADTRHALAIEVTRGPVTFRCGSSSGGDEYVAETVLRTGAHSLAFSPTGNFYVEFQSDADVDRIVKSCAIEGAGTMELDAPWAEVDLGSIRFAQSADVIFIACDGYQQRRIERRASDSWSLVQYAPDKGPFSKARTANVRLKVTETYGNTTLKSDKPFFKAEHVGSLFRLFNEGVQQDYLLGSELAYTDPFKVTGVNEANYNDRNFVYTVAGTWSGTLRWKRSFDGEETGYKDFRKGSGETTATDITTNVSDINNTDGDDNAVVWYKLGFDSGDYTSGTAEVSISYDGSGGYGICRVTGVNSSTSADVEVINRFNSTAYTEDWTESVWSDLRGWPSAVALHKGRLWWAGKTRFVGSVSDDFENFDPSFEGDAGPINRTFGSGPVDTINFLLSLGRLVAGTVGTEYSIKSTSFDEPLTPENTQANDPSTIGSRKGVPAIKVDNRGVFAQRSGKRVFEMVFNADIYDYLPHDLTLLAPDLTGNAFIVGMTVQRQPDTRIHVWLSDGTVILLTYEPSEDVTCWSRIEVGGNGFVERVTVLPGEDEDQVYYRVRRTINGNTVRYLEKMALEADCIGGTVNKQADSFVIVEGVTGTTVTGLGHIEGQEVVAWAAGKDMGAYTVAGGAITLSQPVTDADVMVGLGYDAPYKSTKLAYAAQAGTALTQTKRLNFVGVVLQNTHNDGLRFGRDFDNLDPLPRTVDGRPVTSDEIFAEYDKPAVAFPGEWDTDSRLCLKASAPRPCEILAAVVSVETNERV